MISHVPSKSPYEFGINGIILWVASKFPLVIDAAASVAIQGSSSKYNWVIKVGKPGGVI